MRMERLLAVTHAFDIPGMRLRTQTNNTGHWSNRHREVKRTHEAVAICWLAAIGREKLLPPFLVTLTRVGPRRVDSDNVVSSAKHVRDQIAHCLGIDDGDPRIEFVYAQEIGPYAVKVKVSAGRAH